MDHEQTDKFRKGINRYQHGCDFLIPEDFLASVRGAKFFSPEFLVLSKKNQIFLESAFGREDALESHAIVETLVWPRLRQVRGSYCLLASHGSQKFYYHWMLEALPRLATIQQFDQLSDIPLIVPGPLRPFHSQSLQLAGVRPERLVPFDAGYWQVERLFYPAVPSETGSPSPHAVAWLRSTFLRPFLQRPTRLLYISRRDAPERRVLNEEHIVAHLERRGFEFVCLGTMPLAEQIELFSQARIVIGPHGAGLTNMVFAPPGATLIEFFGDSYVNGCFWALTNICRQNHSFLVTPTGTLDYQVPIEQVAALLDQHL